MEKELTKMDMDKVILTDVDGVLLNWGYAFDVWMGEQGYEKIKGEWKHYCVFEQYGIPEKLGKDLINQFNQSAMVGFIPPLRDAVHYVKKLHELHGYVFHAITSLHKNENAQKLRIMNLQKLFGETVFEKFIILGCGDDKDEALAPYKDTGLPWIEDKEENALLGKELGLDAMMMEHGFNMDSVDVPLVKNWKEIYQYLEG